MPTGYVQRWKGKVQAVRADIGVEGLRQYKTTYAAGAAGAITPSGLIPNAGVSLLSQTSGVAIFQLEPPVEGIEKYIGITTQSSAIFIKASTDGSITFNTTANVLGATVATVNGWGIQLIGLSTSRWGIVGAFPTSTAVGGGLWTLTTTT